MAKTRKPYLRLLTGLLIIAVIFSFTVENMETLAASQIGTVVNVSTTLNVRSGAGTSYSIVGTLKQGDNVTVSGSAKAADNSTWYSISYTSGSSAINGYVHSDYLKVTTVDTDSSFEAYLTSQKFPESYKKHLRTLHAQYPNWVFTALHTNLKWNTVLTEECLLGRNLVSSSSLNSWKSFEKGAYDWDNSKWYGLDGSGWVAASKEIIAYYLDPRNALNNTSVLQFEKLSYSAAYHNADGVKNILKNTFMSESFTAPDTKVTYTYADTFMKAAQVSGVSPYHLASRARQEQGVNGSVLAKGTVPGYEGYFNFFNIKAYSTPSSPDKAVNGAKYAQGTDTSLYLPWTNQYKSILGGAVFLGSSYINKGQDTVYLQKFDVVDGGNGYYAHQYMTNVSAPTSEALIMKNAYSTEMLNSTLVFSIPVYLDMPETEMPKPTSSGDNNNYLASLSITGYSLTPTFSMYTQNYELNVENNVSSIKVNASAKGSAAKVSGTGTITLKEGLNTINIVVTAASGVTKTYALKVYRKPSSGSTTTPSPSAATQTTAPTASATPTPTPTPSASKTTSASTSTSTATTSTATTSTSPSASPAANPTLKSTKYKIGTHITGVSPGTKASDFLSAFTVANGSVKLVNSKGAEHTGTVGTGNILRLYNKSGTLYESYTVVIYGDTNCDGIINVLDLLRVQKHILQIITLTGPEFMAADTSKDSSVNVLDLLKIQKHILELSSISQ